MFESESHIINFKDLPEKHNIRCPKCHLIPFITINNKNTNPILYLQCENKHNINGPLEEIYKNSRNFQIDSIKCQNCNENNISKINYCINCFGFFCEKESHSLNKNHYEIPLQKIDYCCREKEHNNNNVISFCQTHNKNICQYCKQEKHKGDEIKDIIYIKNEQFEKIKNKIENSEKKLNDLSKNISSFISYLKKLIKQIRTEFDKFKNKNELEMKIAYDIINIYEYKKNNNSLNYQIIQNVNNIIFNNIDFNFEKNKFDDIKNKLLEQFKINFVEISNNNKSINENIIDTQENVSTRNSIIESSITEINSFNQTLYELREIY